MFELLAHFAPVKPGQPRDPFPQTSSRPRAREAKRLGAVRR
jgi:hypothetical protein